MAEKPHLIFLHGVGKGDPDEKWRQGLLRGLEAAGYPGLEGVRVIAPRYALDLKEAGPNQKLPPVTIRTPKSERARFRREFEARTSAMEARLARHRGGPGLAAAEMVVDFAAASPFFGQAKNYVTNRDVRAQVLSRILERMPHSGRAVLVAHSLGTVIAVDLIRRLPPGLEIVGVVTAGSPLASGSFTTDFLQENAIDPPRNVGWWVNLWSNRDPVTALRGVSSVFPWLLDLHVANPINPAAAHAASAYLSSEIAGAAIGYGLYGSRNKDIVLARRDVVVPLDEVEEIALQGLRYAHLIKDNLAGDVSERFRAALRHVQGDIVEDFKQRARMQPRPLHPLIAALDFDAADPEAQVPQPDRAHHVSKEVVLARLVALAQRSPIEPFEIEVDRDIRQAALKELTAEMGLGSFLGEQVFDALKTAEGALPGRTRTNWIKWSVLGAGFTVFAIGTAGLALAPAVGLTGAAAVTSALASFGPGGMIGGLLSAGSLVSAGAGGIAVGVMSPANTSGSVETLIASQLALLILRQRNGLDVGGDIWAMWKDAEMALVREINRVSEISDEKAASVVELQKKLEAVQAAMTYALGHGLAPTNPIDEAEALQQPKRRLKVLDR